ncbi:acyltransferase family protein [Flavobacterium pallidum]|uniref:Acyltransferase 3 domain-containing protein n=1 Tax=Flavobacterium pallidum TaxID=2172098 RepID=A0A2S1SI26_9FLAO|nr:acyltransferase [Flavobacterium pallidum]AWI26063.1 hypothetical protein HYN49_09230 [Flavobacterium pallidum]
MPDPTENNTARHKILSLDAMRGALALMVLISHVNLIRLYFRGNQVYNNPAVYHLGRVALVGFFVLSGYLITFTILRRMESGQWHLRGFYRARIFRIWPLYYTVILLAIFVLPHIDALHFTMPPSVINAHDAPEYYAYYFFFLPQIPSFQRVILPFAEPTWSIGVEEIFYLVIPLAVLLAKRKLTLLLYVFIILFVAIKYACVLFPGFSGKFLYKLMHFYRYDCIALGCLAGVMHFNNSKWFTRIGAKHLLMAGIPILLYFFRMERKSLEYFPFAIYFVMIIAFLVNKNHVIKSPKWLVYLGTVSYSFYLTHEIAIVFLVNKGVDDISMPLMYVLSLMSTLGLASVFYFAVEKPFMKWREKLEAKPV